MIVSFRQTYGNERHKLYEVYSKDQRLKELQNLCDVNIHSFHNCNKGTIEKYKMFNNSNNVEYLTFNGVSYTHTIKELKKKLKEMGCTHFLFTQDDTFSKDNNHIDWKELIDYVKEHTDNFMLNLSLNTDMVDIRIQPNDKRETFNVFHLTSKTFNDVGMFPMDDSSYICTIDMLDEIYDDEYLSKGSVWDAEYYLFDKFKKSVIPRFLIADYNIVFMNYNIYGRTISKKDKNIELLRSKGLY